MSRSRLLLAFSISAVAFSAVGPAHAQSFLENMARRAVGNIADRAAGALERGITSGEATGSAAEADESPEVMRPRSSTTQTAAQRDTSQSEPGPDPWPVNLEEAAYTGDWEFDPSIDAQISALHEFSKVRCAGCEGGYEHDSWINTHLRNKGPGGVPGMVGRMQIGETLTWRGLEAAGRLEVVGDAAVGDFACKQVRTTMTRGEHTLSAPGLYCYGQSHSFDREGWHRVLG